MVYTLRFFFSLSSKCSLFHNYNVFGSCIIFYIQGVLKFKKNYFGAKSLMTLIIGLQKAINVPGLFLQSLPVGRSLRGKTKQPVYLYRNVETLRADVAAVEKQWVLHVLSVCLCGVVIQHAVRMLRIMSSVALLAVQYFSILSHKHYEFWGEKKSFTEHKTCVLFFMQLFFSEKFVTVGSRGLVTFQNLNGSSCKVPVILRF